MQTHASKFVVIREDLNVDPVTLFAEGLKIETQPPSVAPSAVGTPRGVATPTTAETQGKKGTIGAAPKKKKDRGKSQGGLTSPTTPSVP